MAAQFPVILVASPDPGLGSFIGMHLTSFFMIFPWFLVTKTKNRLVMDQNAIRKKTSEQQQILIYVVFQLHDVCWLNRYASKNIIYI